MTTPQTASDIERDPTQTWITMYHPELPGDSRSVVTEAAFNMLWNSRGWQRLSDVDAFHSEILGRTVTEENPVTPEEQNLILQASGQNPTAVGEVALEGTVAQQDPEVPAEGAEGSTPAGEQATAGTSKKARTSPTDKES